MSMYQFATAGMQSAGYTGDFESTTARAFNQIMNAEIAAMHVATEISGLSSVTGNSAANVAYGAGFDSGRSNSL